jgi:hypothetical protein
VYGTTASISSSNLTRCVRIPPASSLWSTAPRSLLTFAPFCPQLGAPVQEGEPRESAAAGGEGTREQAGRGALRPHRVPGASEARDHPVSVEPREDSMPSYAVLTATATGAQVQGKEAGEHYLCLLPHYCTCFNFFHEIVVRQDGLHVRRLPLAVCCLLLSGFSLNQPPACAPSSSPLAQASHTLSIRTLPAECFLFSFTRTTRCSKLTYTGAMGGGRDTQCKHILAARLARSLRRCREQFLPDHELANLLSHQ